MSTVSQHAAEVIKQWQTKSAAARVIDFPDLQVLHDLIIIAITRAFEDTQR